MTQWSCLEATSAAFKIFQGSFTLTEGIAVCEAHNATVGRISSIIENKHVQRMMANRSDVDEMWIGK